MHVKNSVLRVARYFNRNETHFGPSVVGRLEADPSVNISQKQLKFITFLPANNLASLFHFNFERTQRMHFDFKWNEMSHSNSSASADLNRNIVIHSTILSNEFYCYRLLAHRTNDFDTFDKQMKELPQRLLIFWSSVWTARCWTNVSVLVWENNIITGMF